MQAGSNQKSDGSTGSLAIDWKIKKANIEGFITYSAVHRDGSTLADILINKDFTFNDNKVDGTFSWTDDTLAVIPDNTIINYKQLYNYINGYLNRITRIWIKEQDKQCCILIKSSW